jgi:hypothetical protein
MGALVARDNEIRFRAASALIPVIAYMADLLVRGCSEVWRRPAPSDAGGLEAAGEQGGPIGGEH